MSEETIEDNQNCKSRGLRLLEGYRKSPLGSYVPLSLLGLLTVALFLRSFGLDWKPPHFDEGINGHFIHEMWRVDTSSFKL